MKPEPPEDSAPDLEVLLRRLPQPVLPPEWRTPVLRAARPPVWPWLTRPVQIGLAAAWACIGAMRLTMPPAPEPLPLAESGQQPAVFPRLLSDGVWPADFELAWLQPSNEHPAGRPQPLQTNPEGTMPVLQHE